MPITPVFDYGRRTGVTSLKRIVKALCVLYDEFTPTIRGWVVDNMSSENAATVLAWLDALTAVCLVVDGTPDD